MLYHPSMAKKPAARAFPLLQSVCQLVTYACAEMLVTCHVDRPPTDMAIGVSLRTGARRGISDDWPYCLGPRRACPSLYADRGSRAHEIRFSPRARTVELTSAVVGSWRVVG